MATGRTQKQAHRHTSVVPFQAVTDGLVQRQFGFTGNLEQHIEIKRLDPSSRVQTLCNVQLTHV